MNPYKLKIHRKIDRWDEGIPLGNGEMGCLVFGSAKKLVLSLDRGDIWDLSASPEFTKGFNYENLKKWVKSKNTGAIYRTFDAPYARPTPTKLPTGRLEITLEPDSDGGSFELDLKKAECLFTSSKTWLKTYTHATMGVGMIKTNAQRPSFKIVNPRFGKKTVLNDLFSKVPVRPAVAGKLQSVKYPAPDFGNETVDGVDVKYFIQQINNGDCFGIATAERQRGDGCEIAYYAYFCNDVQKLKKVLLSKVTGAVKIGYGSLFASHAAWWRDYNSKSSVTVPDEYILNRYNMGNYLLGSASRKGFFPMPLQGLWTACDDKSLPPWKGDYHHDLNTELTYYSFLKANRLEQGECFIDYLFSLKERGQEFAKSFFGADGLCMPSVMDSKGYALGGWAMYSLSPANQIWLCQSFERYYSYTGDMEFLTQKAYPYLEQTARFILCLLETEADGFYSLPLSSSPEIHNCDLKSFLKPNSNYDQAMLTYLFTALERLAKVLKKDDDALLWGDTLKKMRPLAVNDKNILRLSREEDLKESHRHQSHAVAIHPLRLLDYSKKEDKKIINATVNRAVELGTKNFVGYSITWLGEFFAVCKNGDKALEYLEIFWKYFCSVNTFHLNGDYTRQGYSDMDYRPFTLEGNFCAQDVLQEMLLYSENGVIELFPALPKKWNSASFETLRAWGGVLVSAKAENGAVSTAQFTAENDAEFLLRGLPHGTKCTGGKTEETPNGIKVTLLKNETLTLQA